MWSLKSPEKWLQFFVWTCLNPVMNPRSDIRLCMNECIYSFIFIPALNISKPVSKELIAATTKDEEITRTIFEVTKTSVLRQSIMTSLLTSRTEALATTLTLSSPSPTTIAKPVTKLETPPFAKTSVLTVSSGFFSTASPGTGTTWNVIFVDANSWLFERRTITKYWKEYRIFYNINRLLTGREGRTGEYWPEVVAVRTEHSEVRTATTEGQYSPVWLQEARLVNC